MLCQSAHGQRVVSLVVFEVVCLPPAIAVAAFLSGIPDRSPRVVHSFFLSGTLKHSIGGRSTGRTLLPDLVGRLNDRKPVLRSTSGACPFDGNTRRGGYTPAVGGYPQGARAGAPPPIAMAEDANQSHIGHMKKSRRVNFKMLRIAEDDWQIVAECPEMEAHYIEGLKSKEDVDEWLAG